MYDNKIPIVITITIAKKHTVVDVEPFSNIEKAMAHFFILCAEMNCDFHTNSQDFFATKNGKTVYIEWREIL
jgi:hypothetical protein